MHYVNCIIEIPTVFGNGESGRRSFEQGVGAYLCRGECFPIVHVGIGVEKFLKRDTRRGKTLHWHGEHYLEFHTGPDTSHGELTYKSTLLRPLSVGGED